jgi:hypothetical protein
VCECVHRENIAMKTVISQSMVSYEIHREYWSILQAAMLYPARHAERALRLIWDHIIRKSGRRP